MNKRMIGFVIGRLLLLEAMLMVLPLGVSFIYGETLKYKGTYFGVIMLLIAIGLGLSLKNPKNMSIQGREGFVIVALSWILMSALSLIHI